MWRRPERITWHLWTPSDMSTSRKYYLTSFDTTICEYVQKVLPDIFWHHHMWRRPERITWHLLTPSDVNYVQKVLPDIFWHHQMWIRTERTTWHLLTSSDVNTSRKYYLTSLDTIRCYEAERDHVWFTWNRLAELSVCLSLKIRRSNS